MPISLNVNNYLTISRHCRYLVLCLRFLSYIHITNKQNIKIMKQLTEIEKQELEIHRVDNEDLIFETEFDGLLSISKVGDSVGFEVIREETIYLSKEQIKFLLEWLSE